MRFELTTCPYNIIGPEMQRIVQMANLYKQGLAPVAGGVLDQSDFFIWASSYYWSECINAENEVARRAKCKR